ncbi:hypothetical protein OIU79_019727, partial [Salix purpurea]
MVCKTDLYFVHRGHASALLMHPRIDRTVDAALHQLPA